MNEETKPTQTEVKRDEAGLFLPGTAPGPGNPPDTKESKMVKRAIKEIVAEYKENLANALPQIEPVVIAKAIAGDMIAVKEIHDRVMDKAKQPTDIKLEGEIVHQITGMRIQINGDRLQNKEPETTPSNRVLDRQ